MGKNVRRKIKNVRRFFVFAGRILKPPARFWKAGTRGRLLNVRKTFFYSLNARQDFEKGGYKARVEFFPGHIPYFFQNLFFFPCRFIHARRGQGVVHVG